MPAVLRSPTTQIVPPASNRHGDAVSGGSAAAAAGMSGRSTSMVAPERINSSVRAAPRVAPLIALLVGAVVVNACMLVLQWSLLRSLFVGALVAYLPSYFDGAHLKVTEEEGSRFWPALARWQGWTKLFQYFPAAITVENKYDFSSTAGKGGQFVFACHPHGMLSLDHFLIFTDCVQFMSKIAPLPRRDLGASVIFSIPLLRELCLWLGVVDAGARTARKVLGEGYSMQLFPGGIQEQLATNSHKPVIVARQRTGFVKLALSYNTPIVPVYVFGEDKLYTSVSFLLRARKWLVRALRVGWPLFYGRLDRLGLLPHARPLVAVVGEPLWPAGVSRATQERDWAAQAKAKAEARQARKEAKGKKEHSAEATHSPSALQADDSAPPPLFAKTTGRRLPREVSPEEVNAMLDRYVAALEELFDKHKASQPGYEDAKLTVLSARG